METVIAGLLKQFEDGKLTRRQLIRSLALAAVGAPAAAAVAQGAPATAATAAARTAAPASAGAGARAPWTTVWLDHISYAVADYKRSTEFYTNLMGWEVQEDTGDQALLTIGDIGQIIIRNGRRPQDAQDGSRPGSPPLTGVINHIAYGVQPWDGESVRAELERRGLDPRPDMQGETYESYHVTDPDGWDLQISNKTDNSLV